MTYLGRRRNGEDYATPNSHRRISFRGKAFGKLLFATSMFLKSFSLRLRMNDMQLVSENALLRHLRGV